MAELDIGSTLAGHRIEEELGRGGMGIVYRATHLRLGQARALKVILSHHAADEQFAARFEREARSVAAIRHPNVVPIYDFGEDGGVLYIVMPYIEGEDLADILQRSGRLQPAVAASIVDQVARALDEAHASGFVHRDIKPPNILIERGKRLEGGVYLGDFGLAKAVQADWSGARGLTGPGMVLGTYDYMPPEQWESPGDVDARTDVYALGAILFEALTGKVPFPGEGLPQKLHGHVSVTPPRPSELVPGLPARFDEVIGRALAKRRRDRYPSAGDLGRAAVAAARGAASPSARGAVAVGEAALKRTPTPAPSEPKRTLPPPPDARRRRGPRPEGPERARTLKEPRPPIPPPPPPPPPPDRPDGASRRGLPERVTRKPPRWPRLALIAATALVVCGVGAALVVGIGSNESPGESDDLGDRPTSEEVLAESNEPFDQFVTRYDDAMKAVAEGDCQAVGEFRRENWWGYPCDRRAARFAADIRLLSVETYGTGGVIDFTSRDFNYAALATLNAEGRWELIGDFSTEGETIGAPETAVEDRQFAVEQYVEAHLSDACDAYFRFGYTDTQRKQSECRFEFRKDLRQLDADLAEDSDAELESLGGNEFVSFYGLAFDDGEYRTLAAFRAFGRPGRPPSFLVTTGCHYGSC